MLKAIHHLWKVILQLVKQHTRPTTVTIVIGSLSDLKQNRRELIIENAMLRQQLIVLKRQVKRPQLTQGDRLRLVFLAKLTSSWQHALHIVQPDTMLRWHRDLFRRYWRRKSKSKQRKPRISPETIKLIKQISKNNFLWGSERIRGELLKLGIKISKRTIQKYMLQKQEKTSQTWKTFLKNHASQIWACDFTVVHNLLFQPLHIFVIIELQSRKVVHAAVTQFPTDEWTAQQLRDATPWGTQPKYMIRDRDKKFGTHFAAAASEIKILKTPIRAPKANSYCERFIGSLKRECLDHILILHRRQLHRILHEYIDYFNSSRPHQGINQQIPNAFAEHKDRPWPISQPTGRITSTPILGGLHHSYERVTVNTN